MKRILILILAINLLSGCHFTAHLTKRYKRIDEPVNVDSTIKNFVAVDAYSIDKDKPEAAKSKTIFDLSSDGQKALIKEAGNNESDNTKLLTVLTSNLSAKPSSNIEWIDYTKVEKRIIVSLRNKSHWPSDRLSKVLVKLKFGNDITLLSCNKLITEYQNIDLGKVNYSNSNQFEVAGNATTGLSFTNTNSGLSEQTGTESNSNTVDKLVSGTTSGNKVSNSNSSSSTGNGSQGLTSKFSASRSFAEEVLLKQRIVALNASISKNTLSLYQESISGIDLSGNIIADVSFESKDDVNTVSTFSFSDLMIKDVVSEPKVIKAKEVIVTFFNFQKDVSATISYEADFRHVEKNHRTITESDDVISLKHGEYTVPDEVILIPKNQLRPKLWIIYSEEDDSRMPLLVRSPINSTPGELIFTSYAEAKSFLTWLKVKRKEVVEAKGAISTEDYQLLSPIVSIVDDKPKFNLVDEDIIKSLTIGGENVEIDTKEGTQNEKSTEVIIPDKRRKISRGTTKEKN